MRSVAVFCVLTLACAAHAADWRALPSPAAYQAAVDLEAVKTQQGLTQFSVRRSYLEPQPHASGKDVHSARVHYLGDCKAHSVTQVLTESFGEDRKRIELRGRKTVKRSELAPPPAGSEVEEALRLACARLAELGPGDEKSAPKAEPAPAKPPAARSSTASGIVVTREGHVLTNEHVVRQCDALELIDEVNERYKATLQASDAAKDLALLAAETRSAVVAVFRQDPVPQLGEAVVTVGYPLVAVLGTRPSVGFGHVASTVGVRGNPAQMQISVPVQRGASGGPVLDQSGQVIGVVVSKLDALKLAERLGDLAQNVNFAVRGDTVRAFLEAQHVDFSVSDHAARLENTELASRGAAMTVRVRCLRGSIPAAAAESPRQ
jgi:S1-C subfamily serine protease